MARHSRRRIAPGGLAAAAGALTALFAAPAWAQLDNSDNPFRASPDAWVYHSRDGDGFYDGTRVLPIGTHSLGIWATGGAISSEAGADLCTSTSPGAGQELCALDVDFQLSGTGRLLGFTPAPGRTAGVFLNGTGTRLRVNFASGTAPLPAGFPPALLGTLGVAVTGGDTVVTVAGLAALGPDTAEHPVPTHVMFVPEPGSWLLMASALLGLAGLHALRSARAR
jgi:hypothetical protein